MAELYEIPQFSDFLNSLDPPDAKEFQKADIDDPYYRIYRFYRDVYCFIPASGGNEAFSAFFLVVGEDKAALIDTGKGGGDIVPLIRKATDREMIVLYTHEHYDHTGFAGKFGKEYMMNIPESLERVNRGYSWEEIRRASPAYTREEALYFLPDGMCTCPARLTPMQDGEIFDLGNRKLLAIHTPGHTPASACFYDETFGILFMGDSFGRRILLHFHDDVLLTSDFDQYADSIQKLLPYAQKCRYLYFCHSYIAQTADKLRQISDYTGLIQSGDVPYRKEINPIGGRKTKVYAFPLCDFVLPDEK